MEERELPDVLSCDLAYLTRRIDQIPRVSDFVTVELCGVAFFTKGV